MGVSTTPANACAQSSPGHEKISRASADDVADYRSRFQRTSWPFSARARTRAKTNNKSDSRFRYLMASQSRARVQAKFNGGLFTQPLRCTEDDKWNKVVTLQADGSYLATELFKHNEFGDQTKPPILHNGYFYAQFATNRTRDGLVCMSMDGKIMWKTKREPDFKGSKD